MKTDKIQLLNTAGNYNEMENKKPVSVEQKSLEKNSVNKNKSENKLELLRKEIYEKLPLDFINLMNKKYGFFL